MNRANTYTAITWVAALVIATFYREPLVRLVLRFSALEFPLGAMKVRIASPFARRKSMV